MKTELLGGDEFINKLGLSKKAFNYMLAKGMPHWNYEDSIIVDVREAATWLATNTENRVGDFVLDDILEEDTQVLDPIPQLDEKE